MNFNKSHCGYFTICTNIKSLCHTCETNICQVYFSKEYLRLWSGAINKSQKIPKLYSLASYKFFFLSYKVQYRWPTAFLQEQRLVDPGSFNLVGLPFSTHDLWGHSGTTKQKPKKLCIHNTEAWGHVGFLF